MALMTLTLTGVIGGLVIAIADGIRLSSSQNGAGLAVIGDASPMCGI